MLVYVFYTLYRSILENFFIRRFTLNHTICACVEMETTDLYSSIFKRKSIRRYESVPLDEDTIAKITNHIAMVKPLYSNIKTELKILPGNTVNGLFSVKAPHYLAIFSEEKEGYQQNAGFILQQMDLYFSANGIGSCWLGLAKPSKQYVKSSGLNFVITLAFGKPSEPLHRKEVGEFKRLSLERITDVKGMENLLEPARLAPSASNSQTWFFTGSGGRINVYIAKAAILNKLSLVDGGIAICHIWLAANHQGKNFEALMDQEAAKNLPKSKIYLATIKVS